MKRSKLVIFLLLLTSAINSSGQHIYLNYPFYRDGISITGTSHYIMNKQNINTHRLQTPDQYYIGYSRGLVLNFHFNYGIGLHWGLQLIEYSGIFKEDTFLSFSGLEASFNHTLHLDFKLPLSNDLAFGFHTGPGLTFSYLGLFVEDVDIQHPFKEGELKRFDFSYDFAVYMEYVRYRLEVTCSKGLTDHYGKYHRKKLMIGIVYFPFE